MSVILTLGGELVLLFFLRTLKKRERDDTFHKTSAMIMAVYILGVLYITLVDRSFDPAVEINLIPLKTYIVIVRGMFRALVKGEWAKAWQQMKWIDYLTWSCLALNILLFIPFGLLASAITERLNIANKLVLVAAALSLIIEVVQILTKRGWFDVDDIINNTLGAWIGIGLHRRFLSGNRRGTS